MAAASGALKRLAAVTGQLAASATANTATATAAANPTDAKSGGQTTRLHEVVIVGMARTPNGGLQGSLSSLKAPQLGAIAIKAALERAKVSPAAVEEVFMGSVLQASIGQAPARQAALAAGLPNTVPCTTVNKVCASGMKAVMFAAQAIALGYRSCVVAGGMESMSRAPYYLPAPATAAGGSARTGLRMGNSQVVDGMIHDGLWDPYNNIHMGSAAEKTAAKYSITRAAQDEYAVASYQRAQAATKSGAFKSEIVPVTVPSAKAGGKASVVSTDDEPFRVKDFEKLKELSPSFESKQKGGTITAANASVISDGAAALVLMSREKADSLGLKPIAVVRGYADSAGEPLSYPTAPAIAIPQAIKHAGLTADAIDLYEINEAFSVVVLANMQLLSIPHDRINIFGGAVSIGHPIGASGARILITLITALAARDKRIGCAGICNGGGGASALVLERC